VTLQPCSSALAWAERNASTGKPWGVWAAPEPARSRVSSTCCAPFSRLIVSLTGVAADHGLPRRDGFRAAADQFRCHQAAGAIVDQHAGRFGGQGREPQPHRTPGGWRRQRSSAPAGPLPLSGSGPPRPSDQPVGPQSRSSGWHGRPGPPPGSRPARAGRRAAAATCCSPPHATSTAAAAISKCTSGLPRGRKSPGPIHTISTRNACCRCPDACSFFDSRRQRDPTASDASGGRHRPPPRCHGAGVLSGWGAAVWKLLRPSRRCCRSALSRGQPGRVGQPARCGAGA